MGGNSMVVGDEAKVRLFLWIRVRKKDGHCLEPKSLRGSQLLTKSNPVKQNMYQNQKRTETREFGCGRIPIRHSYILNSVQVTIAIN